MNTCRRTAGILDAWLEAGQLGQGDARHLAGCPRCTAVLERVDVAEGAIRTAARSLVLETAAMGAGPTTHGSQAPRSGAPTLRFGAGLAWLAAVVVLMVVAGIRLSTAPAGTSAPLLPVTVEPAEQALHQSGLRCTEVATDLICARGLSDGWRQVARLEVAGGLVRGLEVRLESGTGAFPVADVIAALNEPAADVLGVDLTEAIGDALDADGVACGCERPIEGGAIHVEGDPVAGYRFEIEGVDLQP